MSKYKITADIAQALSTVTDKANAALDETADTQYGVIADTLVALHEKGNLSGIHTVLSTAQGQCKVGKAWNIVRAGITSALKTRGVLFPKARNYSSGKGAFILESKTVAESRKKVEKEREAEIVAESLAEQAEAAAALDAVTTPEDIANQVLVECARLGLNILNVMAALTAEIEATRETATIGDIAEETTPKAEPKARSRAKKEVVAAVG